MPRRGRHEGWVDPRRLRLIADLPAELCKKLYEHPEGLDPPKNNDILYTHVAKECKDFAYVVAKAGDVFITHGLLPHSHSPNYLHYPRVISNPHLNMCVPFNLNRSDGDFVSGTHPSFYSALPPLRG